MTNVRVVLHKKRGIPKKTGIDPQKRGIKISRPQKNRDLLTKTEIFFFSGKTFSRKIFHFDFFCQIPVFFVKKCKICTFWRTFHKKRPKHILDFFFIFYIFGARACARREIPVFLGKKVQSHNFWKWATLFAALFQIWPPGCHFRQFPTIPAKRHIKRTCTGYTNRWSTRGNWEICSMSRD